MTERSYGALSRSLRLPLSVDPDKVEARFHNGVLIVTFPSGRKRSGQRRRSRLDRVLSAMPSRAAGRLIKLGEALAMAIRLATS